MVIENNPNTACYAKKLRRNMELSEVLLWKEIRKRNIKSIKFRRQVMIGPYIVDFCCVKSKLIVEVDGIVHYTPEGREYDKERDSYLKARGFKILRFGSAGVYHSLPEVLKEIERSLT
ncbi:MAG: endonuclease domain-containing protein [Elusimicrobium sp.]|jgi:very-short-patch-repair endonuclease|nr:endonuclease domain-containing protein [Elusimicrobium sp.]